MVDWRGKFFFNGKNDLIFYKEWIIDYIIIYIKMNKFSRLVGVCVFFVVVFVLLEFMYVVKLGMYCFGNK